MLSSSPLSEWHNFAHERRISCGAGWVRPSLAAYGDYVPDYPLGQAVGPVLAARQTHLNTRQLDRSTAVLRASTVAFTHSGIGTVDVSLTCRRGRPWLSVPRAAVNAGNFDQLALVVGARAQAGPQHRPVSPSLRRVRVRPTRD